MKNNKGITLIALVVTIIVLLILAGVSIAMLSGENGILGNAKKARAQSAIGDAKDAIGLKINELQSEFYNKKYVDSPATTDAASATAYIISQLTTFSFPNTTITLTPTGTTSLAIKIEYTSDTGYHSDATLNETTQLQWTDTTP